MANVHAVHYVVFEPPLAAFTACNRSVKPFTPVRDNQWPGVDPEDVSVNQENVTCKLCRSFVERRRRAGPAPRVIARSDEVPF